jgi:hypothetical protein
MDPQFIRLGGDRHHRRLDRLRPRANHPDSCHFNTNYDIRGDRRTDCCGYCCGYCRGYCRADIR